MSPKVSIIIPCYNQGKYIEEAVNSVLKQTYDDFEIIIVNDGSDDIETNNFLKTYSPPKTRILYSENKGVSSARNLGIKEACGTYILPLDGDDQIAPSYVEKAVKVLESCEDIGIVYCEASFFGGRTGHWHLPEYRFPDILVGNCIFCTALYRKKDWARVGGYKEAMKEGWEDWEFWISLIEQGVQVYKIPETLFYYRQAENNMSLSSQKNQSSLMKTIMLYHAPLYIENMERIVSALQDVFLKFNLRKKTLLKVKAPLGKKYRLYANIHVEKLSE